jgi:heme-degrading monooxygenase HmoA
MAGGFATLWEFRVSGDRRAEFEHHYGPQGSWVELFRKADGYVGTQLLHDRSLPSRYLTVDWWDSLEAYRRFRERFAEPYAALDRLCENLTTRETPLGEYDGV